MPSIITIPTPEDPAAALMRLKMFESAQTRQPDARFLANEVLAQLDNTMATTLVSDEYVTTAKMLAARLYQVGEWEYLDREIALLTRKVKTFLRL